MRSALYSVIVAGGTGTRLWPVSRAARPKFLQPLTDGGATLLETTTRRLASLSNPAHTLIVTGAAHAPAVARHCPDIPIGNILVEPAPRDSCAAIGLAAAVIATRDPEAIMACFAADHVIADEPRFVDAIHAAVGQAGQGRLVTIGIPPSHPEPGYGYLDCGTRIDAGPARLVNAFVEKPTLENARRYVNTGSYLWNAGIFVWRVDTFLAALGRLQPDMCDALRAIAAAWDTADLETVLANRWPTLTRISIDYAVMEPAAAEGIVATVPAEFGWNDVGDFHALAGTGLTDEHKNVRIGVDPASDPVFYDSTGIVAVTQAGRLVATVGVHDLVIVDTEDAVLVCARDRVQDVKKVVDQLASDGRTAHL